MTKNTTTTVNSQAAASKPAIGIDESTSDIIARYIANEIDSCDVFGFYTSHEGRPDSCVATMREWLMGGATDDEIGKVWDDIITHWANEEKKAAVAAEQAKASSQGGNFRRDVGKRGTACLYGFSSNNQPHTYYVSQFPRFFTEHLGLTVEDYERSGLKQWVDTNPSKTWKVGTEQKKDTFGGYKGEQALLALYRTGKVPFAKVFRKDGVEYVTCSLSLEKINLNELMKQNGIDPKQD